MQRKDQAALLEDRERIRHMLVAAKDAVFFAQNRSRQDLDSDRMFARAVLHAIMEIGEAAARTTLKGRAVAPLLPWGSIVQMRHILVHAYFNVNYDYVWRVIERDLGSLIDQLEEAVRNWPTESS